MANLEVGKTYYLSPDIIGKDEPVDVLSEPTDLPPLLGEFPKPPSAVESTRAFLDQLWRQHGFGSPMSVVEQQLDMSDTYRNLGALVRRMESTDRTDLKNKN